MKHLATVLDAIRPYLIGRLPICTTVRRLAGLGALILVPMPAEAASLFSSFEYRSFWADVLPIILMAVVAIVVTRHLRKKARQQAAFASADARRSPQERRLHYLSVLFSAAPMIYAVFLEDELVLPVLAIMAAQIVVLIGLRALGLPLRWRLASILPACLVSAVAGELVASWRALPLSSTPGHAWALIACSAGFALGVLLSYLSVPPAYRTRGW